MILFCFRSNENRNCLFSAFSIVVSSDTRYADDLWILPSIELYLNSEFYAKHPSFVKVLNSHSGMFNNVDTLVLLILLKPKGNRWKKKLSIFVVYLYGQTFCLFLLYLQFVCVLLIAIIKTMMLCWNTK